MKKLVILSFILVPFFAARASDLALREAEEYYTISDKGFESTVLFKAPLEVIEDTLEVAQKNLKAIPLFHWIRHNEEPEKKFPAYNRALHFGSWKQDPSDDNCLDTRNKVLSRDASVIENYKDKKKCFVGQGQWQDPYTGQTLQSADELQVDHFVPLKNAYISGAFKWTPEVRCNYANFLEADFHLIAVDRRENLRKSDRTPAGYLPPNEDFVCDYLERWLKVKLTWGLILLTEEVQAIRSAVKDYGCRRERFIVSPAELARWRKAANTPSAACQNLKTRQSL
jgi:hypothetical protein